MPYDILVHHGVLGQKWGVRRYQNKDGSLTPLGKKRLYQSKTEQYVRKTEKDVQSIVDSMDRREVAMMGSDPDLPYMHPAAIKYVAKRFIKRVGDLPVSFLDIQYDENTGGDGNIVVGTRSGEEYRGRGHASEMVKMAKEWLESPEAKDILKIPALEWDAHPDNITSINLAKKHGFVERSMQGDDNGWWKGRYGRK